MCWYCEMYSKIELFSFFCMFNDVIPSGKVFQLFLHLRWKRILRILKRIYDAIKNSEQCQKQATWNCKKINYSHLAVTWQWILFIIDENKNFLGTYTYFLYFTNLQTYVSYIYIRRTHPYFLYNIRNKVCYIYYLRNLILLYLCET